MKHWITADYDWDGRAYESLIDLALKLKATPASELRNILLSRCIYLLFFNQSMRTRTSFISGIARLGGNGIVLDPKRDIYTPAMADDETPYSTERISDVARVLSQYGDAIAIRMYGEPAGWRYGRANQIIREFAQWATIPVINMECDQYHPCQALADMLTIKERFGGFAGRRIVVSWAYSGSWHKPVAVPQSAILASAKLGMDVVLAHPEGFDLDPRVLARTREFATQSGGRFEIVNDMAAAVRGADVVYAKSWCSLKHLPQVTGERVDEAGMKALFETNRSKWICSQQIMGLAKPSSVYMHCLPCDRGQEVTDEVIDGPQSVVFHQAANRLYAQNAIMARLLAGL